MFYLGFPSKMKTVLLALLLSLFCASTVLEAGYEFEFGRKQSEKSALMKTGINYSPKRTKQIRPARSSEYRQTYTRVRAILDAGALIALNDGTKKYVDKEYREAVRYWKAGDMVSVYSYPDGQVYSLQNLRTKSIVYLGAS